MDKLDGLNDQVKKEVKHKFDKIVKDKLDTCISQMQDFMNK